MSRFAYWTILIGSEPTAFRAADAADIMPTLVQLQRKHPDARLQWFARGRLWSSPAEADAARVAERAARRTRPKTWRPGGRHEDPRQKYKDAKKAKWTRFKQGIRTRHEERRAERPARPSTPAFEERRPKRTTEEILADWKPPRRDGEPPSGTASSTPESRPAGAARPPGARDRRPDSRARSSGPGGSRPPDAKPFRERPRGAKPAGTRPDRPHGRDRRPPRKPRKP